MIHIALLLKDIHRERRNGQVTAECPGEQRTLYFQDGGLIFIKTGVPGERLGAVLLATGKITPREFEAIPQILDGQRMIGGKTGGGYNLPGIPWIGYITRSWVALHGCYWHNDYGRRHSNGCINMLPADSKWIFRWTTPFANYFGYSTISGSEGVLPGTNVKIRW